MITKLKTIDTRAAMIAHQAEASSAAHDRFANAQAITSQYPTGLSSSPSVDAQIEASAVNPSDPSHGDLTRATIGSIVQVPLHLIDTNPLSPRHIYSSEDVDRIAKTIQDGQDVAAHGYVIEGRLKLIDGGTRFRAAKVTDRNTLDVKIEPPPVDRLDLFKRARMLNEQRSATSVLDFSLSMRKLLDEGVVSSQRELLDRVDGPKGGKMSEGFLSQLLRVARMPEIVQRRMAEAPETSTLAALYAVSCLFKFGSAGSQEQNGEGEGEGGDSGFSKEEIDLALEITDEIKRRHLNKEQITALVKSRQEGPKTRDRSVAQPVDVGGYKGQIKTFARKGRLELSLSGLSEEQLLKAKGVLINALGQVDVR